MSSKSLFIVTGSSGGFGSAILRQLNAAHGSSAVIIACSRNPAKIAEITEGFTAEIRTVSLDLGAREGIKARCQGVLDIAGSGDNFDHVTLFNNHGSVGDTSKMLAANDDHVELDDYLFLNLTSFQVLTSVFLNSYPGVKHTCVNISSLCGIKPFPSMGMYCTGKAARLMLYKVRLAITK